MTVSFQTGAEPITGYKLLDRLGSGGFGEVWKCIAPGGIYKAVKVIHGDLRQQEDDAYRFAEQELKSLKRIKQIRHPYLLALDRFDIIDGRLVITMELADRNLWDRFRECKSQGQPGIPQAELWQYMTETAEVLDLMNDQYQLQHLDIKPQNLFLLYNHVKVADFGQVKDLEGLVASVTGGITPVYAAPETFDGFVSRFCDQYSLACVYQELLTGIRPFDGNSMQQLLMQHVQGVPNLNPIPFGERSALAKALAKKPDDRFPNVMEMVRAIRQGSAVMQVAVPAEVPAMAGAGAYGHSKDSMPVEPSSRQDQPADYRPEIGKVSHKIAGNSPAINQATSIPIAKSSNAGWNDMAWIQESMVGDENPLERDPVALKTGPGTIRPTLILGLGYSGLRAIQRLRKQLHDKIGEAHLIPSFRMVAIDTDLEVLEAALKPSRDTALASLRKDDLLHLRLNRAQHYLKPQKNGRMLVEGWFDQELLYQYPRTPQTMGVRTLGRLALCEHYRLVLQKISIELDAAINEESLKQTQEVTNCGFRTNLPRIYIVAGLGGGTGSGIFLDLAYTVRAKLKRLGYEPDVVGLLLAPHDSAEVQTSDQARANTYAALTELHHFSHADQTYYASFDDRYGNIVDQDPPFTRTIVVPGLPYPSIERPKSESKHEITLSDSHSTKYSTLSDSIKQTREIGTARKSSIIKRLNHIPLIDPCSAASEFLRLDLLSPVGRLSDENSVRVRSESVCIQTFNTWHMQWPREKVVARVSRIIAPVLLSHWISPENKDLRDMVHHWIHEQWHKLGLDETSIIASLKSGADQLTGQSISTMIQQVFEPLVPRGWMAKMPDPGRVRAAVEWAIQLVGPPRKTQKGDVSPFEQALKRHAAELQESIEEELIGLFPRLLDSTSFRLVGAEEVVRLMLANIRHVNEKLLKQQVSLQKESSLAHDVLAYYMYPQPKNQRKTNQAELVNALEDYPVKWYQRLIVEYATNIYGHLIPMLEARLADLQNCRSQLEIYHQSMVEEAEYREDSSETGALLPVGCRSIEDAAQRFIHVLNDDDLAELEQRLQAGIEQDFGGVFEVCVNSAGGPEAVYRVLRDTTKIYLNERLGDVDLAGMVKQAYGSPQSITRVLQNGYESAAPTLIANGPWSHSQFAMIVVPPGASGEPLIQFAQNFLPANCLVSHMLDEALFYREYPNIPISALDQLGPLWSNAYGSSKEIFLTSSHSRIDITDWIDIDS